ncbi:hypothetical protein B5F76_08320 [Desulfovibrio sp. An276]|uniref:SNF2-related protein n=1 Tax=Desulfovibrio sp. An276 TaxID=1965618 RepID=UPI000B3930FD|nr:DEAD/DEAH box helicase [Desulfovibrio sp. An276]OUO52008.1 hypothetical protein B5F76_08320 [Desulfovibrio sp. An276]
MPDALKDYQQRVIDKLYGKKSPRGVIAYHSTGSGKTYTALSALSKALQNKDDRALWIAPASLTTNFEKERVKHGLQYPGKVDVYSYEKARNLADKLKDTRYKLIVLDEAHKLRNSGTSLTSRLKPVLDNSDKVLMLTGTAGYNHPSDMMSLISLMDSDAKVPRDRKEFISNYVDDDKWKIKNRPRLKNILDRYIDVYETPKDSADFPRIYRKVIDTEMSPHQVELYRYLENKIPSPLRKKVRNNLPMSLREATNLNAFSTGIRQASNSISHHQVNADPFDSEKLRVAADRMARAANKTDNFRGVAYSNFLDAGILPYEKILQKHGLKPIVFTGGLDAEQKKKLVADYNTPGGKKILLLSSSGSEGLDLKGTRLLQILEPHFNRSKIQQVEGRGARYHSHIDLPEDQRNITIEEYHSKLPPRMWQKLLNTRDTSIDEYLAAISNMKQQLTDDMRGLAKK